MKNVETQKRGSSNRLAAEQSETNVTSGGNQGNISKLDKGRTGALMAHQWSSPGHVGTDCDRQMASWSHGSR